MQLYQYTLKGWVHPADVFCSLFGDDSAAFWLDREYHPTNRKSIIGHAFGGKIANLGDVKNKLDDTSANQEAAFGLPGFVGWIEYPSQPSADYSEHSTESVRSMLLEVREAMLFDHDTRNITMVGHFEREADFEHWVQAILLRLALAGGEKAVVLHRAKPANLGHASVRHSRAEYLELIKKAQQHIAAGDVYQLCLTNQISVETDANPLVTFLRLRDSNPAPYACFIRHGNRALVSSSPEQFFSLSAEGQVSTKPIKGTRARHVDPVEDAQVANELQNNAKERAENLMIVDLMRNDFSKFCLEGTVQVEKLFDIESYSTVHQLVSTVTGQLDPAINPVSALLSAFPGGSMTGAPKLRAQQLIREFESGERGVYSGISGVIGVDGNIEMAMNIRCLVFENGTVTIGVGGGITSDSDPAAEFEETQLKAKALLTVLGASVNW